MMKRGTRGCTLCFDGTRGCTLCFDGHDVTVLYTANDIWRATLKQSALFFEEMLAVQAPGQNVL